MNVGNLFNFNGRIGRGEFWLRSAAFGITFFLVMLIVNSMGSTGMASVITVVAYLLYFVLGLSSSVKRWHDRGKSGKWVFLSLVPIVGSIWSFIELGFMPGTDGANEYGPPGSGSATHEPELEAETYVLPSRFSGR